MTITQAFRAYLAQLTADELPEPLNQPMPLFAVIADLCRHAGEPEPAEVAALMDAPAVLTQRPRFAKPGAARWVTGGGDD